MKKITTLSAKTMSQHGLTLIEVLVSMGLGIFFLGIAVQYLVVGQQSNQVHDAGSRIQENARFANNLLRESIRLSGYNGDPTTLFVPEFIYTGACDEGPDCTDDEIGDNRGDRIAVTQFADSNVSQDCLGTAVTAGTRFANVFWVEEVNGVRSLYCQGWDINASSALAGAQPLVDGIEQMQVQYGLSNVGAQDFFGPVVGFLSAEAVQALDGWDFVRSVRISILVDSGLQTDESNLAGVTARQAASRTYALLDGPNVTLNDDRIRRVYTATIELNNSSIF